MAKKDNQLETVLVQLEALCSVQDQKDRMNDINKEVEIHRDVQKNKLKNNELYSTLHLTRSLDTSLRLFLDINNILAAEHSLGDYLKKLANHSNPNLKRLNSGLKDRFKSTIVDERNKYMHSSGSFPNTSALNQLETSVCFCLQTILNLK